MSCRDVIVRLSDASPAILPSLLLCDFGNLEREVARLEEARVPALHLDVMDGSFVPNLTYGMPIVAALRRLTDLPLDVHLMIDRPERYLEAFRDAGADALTIHVEAAREPEETLARIRELGMVAGLAINPSTPFDRAARLLSSCDLFLVMSVPAGFGGQAFDEVALERLRAARELAGDDLLLEVDGGINADTIGSCVDVGAQLFVVGSAIFRAADYRNAVADLRRHAVERGG